MGLLLGIYMAVNAATKAQRGVLIQEAGKHPADFQEVAETDERGLDEKIMEPKLLSIIDGMKAIEKGESA